MGFLKEERLRFVWDEGLEVFDATYNREVTTYPAVDIVVLDGEVTRIYTEKLPELSDDYSLHFLVNNAIQALVNSINQGE